MDSETQNQILKIKELFADGWITEYEKDKRIKELNPNYTPNTVVTSNNNNVSQSFYDNSSSMQTDNTYNNITYNNTFDNSYSSSSNNSNYSNQTNEIVFKSYDNIPVLNENFSTLDINQTNNNNRNRPKPPPTVVPKPVEEAKPIQQGTFGAMFLNSSTIGNSSNPIVKVVGDAKRIQFVPLGTTCQTYIDIRNFIRSSNNQEAPDQPSQDTTDKWKKEQFDLAKKVDARNVKILSIKKENCNIKYIGGVDISFGKGSSIDACACLVVIEYPSLKVVYQSYKMVKLTEPYIAGYLAFREAPHLLPLWQDLLREFPQYKPDVLIIDGNGINHMRACGSACHMGVLMDIPTIGVAKNLLYANGITADYIANGFTKGNVVDMIHQNTKQSLGHAIFNSQKEIIYVSPGHKLDSATALAIVQATMNNRPIPESTFQADKLSRDFLYKYYTQFPTR